MTEKMAIVGGGISGLTQALAAVEAGCYDVTVFEAAPRIGGKIANGAFEGKAINLAAEFCDSDQKCLIELAKKMGVNLLPSDYLGNEKFQLPDGTMISGEDFHKIYKPLAEMIIEDKKRMQDDPIFAKYIDKMSLSEYLSGLSKIYEEDHGKKLDPKIVETIAGAYASECGRDCEQASALHFLGEASDKLGSHLSSDCDLYIEGGTAALLEKIKAHLEEKGVKFQTGAKLEELKKDSDGKFDLGFTEEKFDKVGLALSAHALAQIKGLENFGMTEEEKKLLSDIQYTHSSKIFLKVKPDIEKATLYSVDGWQSWVHDDGILTVLAGGEKLNNMGKEELTKFITERYAKAYGKKVEDIFEKDENGKFKMVFGGADSNRPCYAAPAPNQFLAMERLHDTMKNMAKNGVAIAGTFMPKDGSIGFMECGVQSAQKSVEMVKTLSNSVIAAMQETIDGLQKNFQDFGSWVERITRSGVGIVGAPVNPRLPSRDAGRSF